MSMNVTARFATLWNPQDRGTFLTASVSTARKDKGEKKYSNWNVKFVSEAFRKISGVPERTQFDILNGIIETNVVENEDGKKQYTNVTVFDIEILENNAQQSNNKPTTRPKTTTKTSKPTENQVESDEDDGLPWAK